MPKQFMHYKKFPCKSIKTKEYWINTREETVCIDGMFVFSLADLKQIDLNIRLSLPHKLFVAIHQSKSYR